MKTILNILILPLFFSGCYSATESEKSYKEKNTAQLFSNDFLLNEKRSDFEIINLDSLQNFNDILNNMERLSCANKSTGLEFTFRDTIYHMTGFTKCPTSEEIACYFSRNIIIIKNDSLKNYSGDSDKMVPLENLDKEIEKIRAVDHHFQFNKNILNPALIHMYVDNKYPISKTKIVLREIARQFEKINSEMGTDYFKYNIFFEGGSVLDIPPPPPPPEMGE